MMKLGYNQETSGAIPLFILVFALVFALNACSKSEKAAVESPRPTLTPEPIVPTRTRQASAAELPVTRAVVDQEATTTAAEEPTATPPRAAATIEAPPPTADAGLEQEPAPIAELSRYGIGIARGGTDAEEAYAAGLRYGSALDWNVHENTPDAPLEFWQMVRLNEDGLSKIDWDDLALAIAANPGSKWMIGNEPDVRWQDNVTPQKYAEIYHDIYHFIKEQDQEAQVAIGGVSQPTALRRAYLDIVLDTYEQTYGEPMPIDIWNVHAFILREEDDSWGVGIPPGMDGEEGMLYEIDDHDDIEIFAGNLFDFRHWMAGRGYGDKPLVVSEYGILMPADYGFPPQRVATFMESSFVFFREAKGPDGFAADGDRLVQWWFWYSLFDEQLYPTGNLWDGGSGELTQLGERWTELVRQFTTPP